MTTVGILGGGQLARMLALAGAPLGLRFLVMDAAQDACAAQFVPQLLADYRDEKALAEFARRVDVATFDFENVPAVSAHWLAERIPVFPAPSALAIAQDRLAEKNLFRELNIDVPAFAVVDSREALDSALETVGVPAILKTRRLGYDGKGQFRLRQHSDADAAWQALGAGAVGLILEAWVPFGRELSVLAVRGRDGSFRAWPLTENWHADGILAASLAPAEASPDIERMALDAALKVAQALDYVGVFALELFVCGERLLANEIAPRVHNSGHWTIEGARTSQFENHLRAVLGLPLGSSTAIGHSCMLNWVGTLPDREPVLASPYGHWHDYGKAPREGRKVGHATWCAEDREQLARAMHDIGESLQRQEQVAGVLSALSLPRLI